MPIVGRGTRLEKTFPYTMEGIREAEDYASQANPPLEVDYEQEKGLEKTGKPSPIEMGAKSQPFNSSPEPGLAPSAYSEAMKPAHRRMQKLR